MNKEDFKAELKKLSINLSEEQMRALETYKDMLIEHNNKFNLTAIKTEEEIYLKHFYDSLTITKVVDLNSNLKVLDIGTGAGFPGLVLKIVFPCLDITLLDSNNKKITFLNNVIEKLNLKNIRCIYGRAEELNDNYREHFDIITSRAVAHLRILSELSIPFLKIQGYFIPMKGKLEPEFSESKSTLKILNTSVEAIEEFLLPIEKSNRTILKIKKVSCTPKIYPRNYNTILKKPLK